jgi:hypothetical protein
MVEDLRAEPRLEAGHVADTVGVHEPVILSRRRVA